MTLSLMVIRNVYSDLSTPDTLGPEKTVLIVKVLPFRGLKMYYGKE